MVVLARGLTMGRDGAERDGASSKLILTVIALSIFLTVALIGVGYLFFTRVVLTTDNDSIRDEIVPVAKLTTVEYNFTQILFLSDAGNPLNITNPITSKRFVATIDGSIPIQVDVEKLYCEGQYNPDQSLRGLVVHLPHAQAGEVTLYHETAKKYVEDNGFLNLNQVSTDDLNSLYVQAEKEQLAKLESSEVLEQADAQLQSLITAQVQSIHGDDVVVSFDYIEEE